MELTGLRRNTLDKFYTKQETAIECVKKLLTVIPYTGKEIFIEPSAGNGAFIKSMHQVCPEARVLAYDIEPDHETIHKQDFLTWSCPKELQQHTLIIFGNPPFGRQSSLAIQFIRHATTFADTIAFILPKSFKKSSMQRHFPVHYTCVLQYDLPENSFLVNHKEHDVPCVFQIWNKSSQSRSMPNKHIPKGYIFLKKENIPYDALALVVAFRRVGVYAGKIYNDNILEKSHQSHYFIQFENQEIKNKCLEKYDWTQYEHDNTVGPKSLSKQDCICYLNTCV